MSAHRHTPESPRASGSGGNGADHGAASPATLTLRFSSYELDFARKELRRSGALVALQPTPLRVLLYLAEHRDRTVSRRELLDAIWPGVVVGDEALTTALAEARHAVGDDGAAQRVIRTLKGAGYRFVAELTAAIGPPASANEAALAAEGAARTASGGDEAKLATATRSGFARRALLAGVGLLVLSAIAAAVWLRPAPPALKPVPFGLAVLPIQSLSSAPADQQFADGLTDQIAHALASRGYPIVARTTSAQWRARAADVRELGANLGVSHVLEGSLRRERGLLRAALRVVTTDSGKQLWSGVLEESDADAFAAQDRIAERVTHELARRVWPYENWQQSDPVLARVSGARGEAANAFFEGDYAASIVIGDRLLEAIPNREPYLAIRSDTAAVAAMALINLYSFRDRTLRDAGPDFLARAQRAVAIDPTWPHAHSILARAYMRHWRWAEAEREMRRACELAPRVGMYCGTALEICAALGCVEEQLAGAKLLDSQFGDAQTQGYWLTWALGNNNRFEEAEAAGLRAIAVTPNHALYLASVQWQLGKRDAALASALQFYSAMGQREVAQAIRSAGSPEAAWRWLADHWAAGDIPLFPNFNEFLAARHYIDLGDVEAALNALERSVAEHEVGMEWFAVAPYFDSIRNTPRFRALIEKMGLTAYHEKYGVFERARQRVAAAAPDNESAR